MQDTMTRTDVTLSVRLKNGGGSRIIARTRMTLDDASPHGDFIATARMATSRMAGGPVSPTSLYGAFLELWSGMGPDRNVAELAYDNEITVVIERGTPA